jgi:hypothetical protein
LESGFPSITNFNKLYKSIIIMLHPLLFKKAKSQLKETSFSLYEFQ